MEFLLVFAVAVGAAILNSLHVIIQWLQNPPDRIFTGIAHFFADYFLYVSQMAQGASGSWIFSQHLFTNEQTNPTWYYWFNVVLGHIGNLVGLSPFATYNVSLFLLVVCLCLVLYKLSKTIYPANRFLRLTAWLMILTATNFFWDGKLLGQFWFSPSAVFSRLGAVPYHVFQTIVFILLPIAFTKIKNSLFLILLAALAAMANPVQMLLFTLAAAVTEHARGSVLVAIFGGLGAWMTNQEFGQQAVFMAARTWELTQDVPNHLSILLLSIGPVVFFVPFGIRKVFSQKNPLRLLLVAWGLLSFALFLSPIPKLLDLSPVRFLHPVPWAATLAILGTEGLIASRHFLSRLKGSAFGAIVLYALFTIPSLSAQFMDRITPARSPLLLLDTIYNHVPRAIVDGLTFLKTQKTEDARSVVLTDPKIPIEVLVPVFTGKISFSGHPIHTLYPDVKEGLRQQFFNGSMDESSAKTFLTNHRIGYVIAPPKTKMVYPFLMRVFENESLVIYKVTT